MEPYIVVLTGFGLIVLLTAWLPMVLKDVPLSLPIVCVGIGMLVFALPYAGPAPHPLDHQAITERLTEFVVIIALMGAGLKIDRPFNWRSWAITWRLLVIAMPLTILALAVAGMSLLGLGLASAMLLASALAPTDPVLASDIQVGPPGTGEEDEARFSLTSEAGLNDGLAFPFVNLAIALALHPGEPVSTWLSGWFWVDVVWKLLAGVVGGYGVGWAAGYLAFRLPDRATLSKTGDGFVALGLTCVAYGVTELIHGYGFIAVFVAAMALRNAERGHQYHERLHDFAEQTERLLMMVLLVLFGGAITAGGLFAALDWTSLVYAALALFVIRPLSGLLSMAGSSRPAGEKIIISFFGIRGLGSFYYLSYALGQATFPNVSFLWATMSLVVFISIILHGITVTPVIRRFDAKAGRGDKAVRLRA